MSTPNFGTPDTNISGGLGDVSKLAFLDDIPLNVEGEAPPSNLPAAVKPADSSEAVKHGVSEAVEQGEADDSENVVLGLEEPSSAAQRQNREASQPNDTNPVNPNGTVSAKKGVRDYSGIKPEDVPIFKQMSDAAYARTLEWYKNQRAIEEVEGKYTKELSELKDYRFYSHPEAYKFSPEYTQAAATYRSQSAAVDHWEKALERLENGEPIQDIAVDKTGAPILDEYGRLTYLPNEYPASPKLKAHVTAALQKALTTRGRVEESLESLSTKYQGRNKEFVDFTSKAISALVSPQLLEDTNFKSIHDRYLNKVIPSHLHDVPVLTGRQAAQIMSFVQLAAKQISALQKRGQVAGMKAVALKEQGPGDGVPATGEANWQDRPMKDVLAEFEGLRNR